MARNGIKSVVLACGVIFSLAGCSAVKRVEKFSETFRTEFEDEYGRRSNQNITMFDKYQALQQMGDLQRDVFDHRLEPREAKRIILDGKLDEKAYDAVRSIAQHALHRAWRNLPEVKALEELPRLVTENDDLPSDDSVGEILWDFLRPKPSVSFSLSGGKFNVRPSLRLGRVYKFEFESLENEFDHRLTFRYDDAVFSIKVKHDLKRLESVQASVLYALPRGGSLGINYLYNHELEEHVGSFGVGWRF